MSTIPFEELYQTGREAQRERYRRIAAGYEAHFGKGEVSFFSAPGRTEVGGNHTDHNHGNVLAAAVNLDIVAAAAPIAEPVVRLHSEEYPGTDEIILSELAPQKEEEGTSAALLRGVCARCRELGYRVGGFQAYTATQVLKGSGLSSSAAFEIALVTIISHLFNDGGIDPVTAAQIAQYAENVYFGKPSGLMDQMACSVGGFTAMDFRNPKKPVLEKVEFPLEKAGYALCIVDTGGNHADLTGEYAAIPAEMKAVARELGASVLRDVQEEDFHARIGELRQKLGDRAVLRALHFFRDNTLAQEEAACLKERDFPGFLYRVVASGRSSALCLQNLYACSDPAHQGLTLALALSESILEGKGAWRVHGGGFAGTIQAFVPREMLETYRAQIEAVFGEGACHVLSVRSAGGVRVKLTKM